MGIENVQSFAAHDPYQYIDQDKPVTPAAKRKPNLDSDTAQKLHSELMSWLTAERTKQSINRYQMALDADFYDGLQWSPEDSAALMDRGQWPLVFNLVKPTVDWIIGTQRRMRSDWHIIPRTNRREAAETAQAKTSFLKYIRDVNQGEYHQSRAFMDSVISGVGWLECGVRGDDTDEPVFEAYESWRNIIYDSSARNHSLEDGRYLFRWKWIDEDIGLALFPEREHLIRAAVQASINLITTGTDEDGEEFWYLGAAIAGEQGQDWQSFDRRTYVSDTAWVNYQRRRCKLIEGWYTKPVKKTVMRGDAALRGMTFDKANPTHRKAHESGAVSLYDCMAMEMQACVFTSKGLLWTGKSPYLHNKFPFTPWWCYRRGRDGAPYGVVRQLRDPQEVYNKRHSKVMWILSGNRVVLDEGAVEDLENLRDEVARPDAVIAKRQGYELNLQKDYQEIAQQAQMMEIDRLHIEATGGVTNENLGRETNATSGKAIEARQLQGSVTTAQIYDQARLAFQLHGQKLLSVCEQYVTEPRAVRIVGAKARIEWLQINEPVEQPDGSVRFLNDITEEQADFIVSEQDFHASVRAAMFAQMMELLGRFPPEIAVRILPRILELADIPDKDEFINDIREALGMSKPMEDASEEEKAALEQQQAQQQQIEQLMQDLQIRTATAQAEEAEGKAKLAKAQATKAKAETQKVIAETAAIISPPEDDEDDTQEPKK